MPSTRVTTLALLLFITMLHSGALAISALTQPEMKGAQIQQTTNSTTTTTTQVARSTDISALILGLVAIPATIATVLFVYKYASTPLQLPFGQILKRRTPPHLRPLRVLNGAICPMCFRPMTYEPKGEDWHCEHCGVYYEA